MKPRLEEIQDMQKTLDDAHVPLENRHMHYVDEDGVAHMATTNADGEVIEDLIIIVE